MPASFDTKTNKWMRDGVEYNPGLQYDEKGRPYYDVATGGRSYVSPAAMRTGDAPDGMQWNQETGDWEPEQSFIERMAPLIPALIGTAGIAGGFLGGGLGGVEAGSGVSGGMSSALPGAINMSAATTIPSGAAASLPGAAAKLWGGVKGAKSLLGATAQGIENVTDNAAHDRALQEQLALTANGQNISGNSAFEAQLINRAKEEAAQRVQAQKDAYRQSYVTQNQSSPNNPRPGSYTPAYLAAMTAQGQQAGQTLGKPRTYDMQSMPGPKPYVPIDPKDVQGATGTKPGTLEKVGRWLGPGLSIADQILDIF